MTDQHRMMRAEYKVRRNGTTNLSDVLTKIRSDGWRILDFDIDGIPKGTGKKRYINIKCMDRVSPPVLMTGAEVFPGAQKVNL